MLCPILDTSGAVEVFSLVVVPSLIFPFPANASLIKWSASLIPAETETSMTRFPAKRSAWTSLSAAIITASA